LVNKGEILQECAAGVNLCCKTTTFRRLVCSP